jgi:2'-5' RNA ligase
MPKARLGVALLLPPGVAAEVDGLRRALGDGALGRIPAHLTLVPPVNVREDRLGDALAVLRSAAAATRPLVLTLGPPATFLPDNPVLYLTVGGDTGGLRRLRDAVFAEPLARPLTWPWVPHVTVADEAEPARLDAALAALADYRVDVRVDRVHLLREGPGRVWEPLADAPFAPATVVGRGGLPLDLVVSDLVDPEGAALAGGGRPFCVTARRDGAVVGVATGSTADADAVLDSLVVAERARREGVGSHLLAAVASVAAERGCAAVVACVGPGEPGAAFLRHKGWVPDGARLRRDL